MSDSNPSSASSSQPPLFHPIHRPTPLSSLQFSAAAASESKIPSAATNFQPIPQSGAHENKDGPQNQYPTNPFSAVRAASNRNQSSLVRAYSHPNSRRRKARRRAQSTHPPPPISHDGDLPSGALPEPPSTPSDRGAPSPALNLRRICHPYYIKDPHPLQELFPALQLHTTSTSSHTHPICATSRYICEYYLFTRIIKLLIPNSNGRFWDVCGTLRRHKGFSEMNPNLLRRSPATTDEEMDLKTNGELHPRWAQVHVNIFEYVPKDLNRLAESRDIDASKVCQHRIEECDCFGDGNDKFITTISTDVLYYLTPDMIISICERSGDNKHWAIHHNFSNLIGAVGEATYRVIVTDFDKLAEADVQFYVDRDVYQHSALLWLDYDDHYNGFTSDEQECVLTWENKGNYGLHWITCFTLHRKPHMPTRSFQTTTNSLASAIEDKHAIGEVNIPTGRDLTKVSSEVIALEGTRLYSFVGQLLAIKEKDRAVIVPKTLVDELANQITGQERIPSRLNNLIRAASKRLAEFSYPADLLSSAAMVCATLAFTKHIANESNLLQQYVQPKLPMIEKHGAALKYQFQNTDRLLTWLLPTYAGVNFFTGALLQHKFGTTASIAGATAMALGSLLANTIYAAFGYQTNAKRALLVALTGLSAAFSGSSLVARLKAPAPKPPETVRELLKRARDRAMSTTFDSFSIADPVETRSFAIGSPLEPDAWEMLQKLPAQTVEKWKEIRNEVAWRVEGYKYDHRGVTESVNGCMGKFGDIAIKARYQAKGWLDRLFPPKPIVRYKRLAKKAAIIAFGGSLLMTLAYFMKKTITSYKARDPFAEYDESRIIENKRTARTPWRSLPSTPPTATVDELKATPIHPYAKVTPPPNLVDDDPHTCKHTLFPAAIVTPTQVPIVPTNSPHSEYAAVILRGAKYAPEDEPRAAMYLHQWLLKHEWLINPRETGEHVASNVAQFVMRPQLNQQQRDLLIKAYGRFFNPSHATTLYTANPKPEHMEDPGRRDFRYKGFVKIELLLKPHKVQPRLIQGQTDLNNLVEGPTLSSFTRIYRRGASLEKFLAGHPILNPDALPPHEIGVFADKIIAGGYDTIVEIDFNRWDALIRLFLHFIKIHQYQRMGMPDHVCNFTLCMITAVLVCYHGTILQHQMTVRSGKYDTKDGNSFLNLLVTFCALHFLFHFDNEDEKNNPLEERVIPDVLGMAVGDDNITGLRSSQIPNYLSLPKVISKWGPSAEMVVHINQGHHPIYRASFCSGRFIPMLIINNQTGEKREGHILIPMLGRFLAKFGYYHSVLKDKRDFKSLVMLQLLDAQGRSTFLKDVPVFRVYLRKTKEACFQYLNLHSNEDERKRIHTWASKWLAKNRYDNFHYDQQYSYESNEDTIKAMDYCYNIDCGELEAKLEKLDFTINDREINILYHPEFEQIYQIDEGNLPSGYDIKPLPPCLECKADPCDCKLPTLGRFIDPNLRFKLPINSLAARAAEVAFNSNQPELFKKILDEHLANKLDILATQAELENPSVAFHDDTQPP